MARAPDRPASLTMGEVEGAIVVGEGEGRQGEGREGDWLDWQVGQEGLGDGVRQ